MDNATHAFAGLLLADATSAWVARRTGVADTPRRRRAIALLGVVAAELPDADLLYSGPVVGMGKLGYLLHHRGHTHTIVFAVVAALLLWWMTLWFRRRPDGAADARERLPLLVLALAGTLSHILLDFTNVYGVHPFWPLDNRWIYGDAVFIVEPWLWVVAIPPLLFGVRARWNRALLGALLCVIVGLSWTAGQMSSALAAWVTVGAAVSLAAFRLLPASRRVAVGIATWCVVEAVFSLSSARAASVVRSTLRDDERVLDIVLSPGAANAGCFDLLLVTLDGGDYRVRAGAVAPWRRGQAADDSASCRTRGRGVRFAGYPGTHPVARSADARLAWHDEWRAPVAELRALNASRCEFAAALRFLRVPVWRTRPDGGVELSDARFGVGGGGFSDLRIATGACPLPARAWIPPWTPPRTDALGNAGP